MSKEEVIEILGIHQKWRRGADIEMVHPKKLGEAIDYAIEFLRGNIK